MLGVIRVLVVDDSAFVRKVVRGMLVRSPHVEVIGTARDGEEALELVSALQPDVVTLDLHMPRLGGLEFLKKQMAIRPLPVVLLSVASEGGELVMKALDAGAVEVVQKPTALASERMMEVAEDLIAKVKAAAVSRVPVPQLAIRPGTPIVPRRATRTDIVVIGVSTGGPQALKQIVPLFPKDFPVPVAIVLHMPVGYTELYAKSLNEISPMAVQEARNGDLISPGVVLVGQAGYHLTFERQADLSVRTRLSLSPLGKAHRPSVDVLFQSAADAYGDRVLGAVLTGMGNDGTLGAASVKANGGRVLTEAEESCVVYGMPRSVVEAGFSDTVVPLSEMARTIIEAL